MKKAIIILLCLGAATGARAGILSADGPEDARQYGRADFSVLVDGTWTNPYLCEEVTVDLVLSAPSGTVVTVPCFHAGDRRWEARFLPQEKGTYVWKFRVTEPGKPVGESEEGILNVSGTAGHGILHPNDDWTLKYDDGTLFRGVAENICWESRSNDDSRFFKDLHEQHDRFNYDVMLPAFAARGGNFCRMWMCSWNFPIDRHRNFNNPRYEESDAWINPSAAARLDHVVALAESLDLRIMLCMGAGDVRTDRDFFVSEEAKARYRNYLRYIVARWGHSPAIGMWEFFNEIDNIQFRDAEHPIPAEEIVAWHTEMAAYLKALDPYGHIVTTSISHRDLAGLNDVADMDINQKHIYCATSSIPENIFRYEAAHGKPYVIGEFGYEWDWSKNFDDFADDMIVDFKRGLWYGLLSPTPVTPMSWWWEWFEEHGVHPYFRNVRLVNDRMLAAGNGSFKPVAARADGAEAFAVRCGGKTYVYVYNPSERVVSGVKVPVGARNCRVSSLDFSMAAFGKARKMKSAAGELNIPLSLPAKGEALFEIQ